MERERNEGRKGEMEVGRGGRRKERVGGKEGREEIRRRERTESGASPHQVFRP